GISAPKPGRSGAVLAETGGLQVVVGWDYLSQAVLCRTVAAICVRMVLLDERLEAGLDLLAALIALQIEGRERLPLQVAERPANRFALPLRLVGGMAGIAATEDAEGVGEGRRPGRVGM